MGDAVRTDGGLIVEVRDRVAYATLDRPERLNALSVRADQRPRRRVRLVLDRSRHLGGPAHEHGRTRLLRRCGPEGHGRGRRPTRCVDRRRPRVAVRPQGRRRSHDRIASQLLRGHPRVREADRRSDVRLGHGWRLWLGLACDIRIAADDLRIGMPETKRGLGANFGSVVLPRVVPSASPTRCSTPASRCRGGRAAMGARAGRGAEGGPRPARRGPRPFDRGQRPAHQPALQGHGHQGPRPPRRCRAAAQRRPQPVPLRGPQRGVAAFLERREPRWQAR